MGQMHAATQTSHPTASMILLLLAALSGVVLFITVLVVTTTAGENGGRRRWCLRAACSAFVIGLTATFVVNLWSPQPLPHVKSHSKFTTSTEGNFS